MTNGDWVDRKVRQVWSERPGIGIQELKNEILTKCKTDRVEPKHAFSTREIGFVSLECPPDPSMISKARIKNSKAWIPYKRTLGKFELTDAQCRLVETKLQERIGLRATRQFDRADKLQNALEAMGIDLNDHLKTWTVAREPPSGLCLVQKPITAESPLTSEKSTLASAKSTCQFCQKTFPSRNHLFKHLRDPTSGCGTAIFAAGKEIEAPPSALQTKLRREEIARRRNKKSSVKTTNHATTENSLWVGDLPIAWTNPRKQFCYLRALLFRYIPREVPTPWIKRVIRKGYRKEALGTYHGYAIVVFRDEAEAKQVLQLLDGHEVDSNYALQGHTKRDQNELASFRLKVRRVENEGNERNQRDETDGTRDFLADRDPPLLEQLRPLDLEEIRRRIAWLEQRAELSKVVEKISKKENKIFERIDLDDDPADRLLSRLCHLYSAREEARRLIPRTGRPIPEDMKSNLLKTLESLRWPARNERKNLAAERYLVLQTNVTSDRFYANLRSACAELMQWADPNYQYSGIAVTKNFVGSPHIDHRDRTFQYAVSLGNFEGGGELCVEGEDKTTGECFLNVVSTHNCIARVEGRHVHYVRTWHGGDRYSLIFYDTSDRNHTPVMKMGVDGEFAAPIEDATS